MDGRHSLPGSPQKAQNRLAARESQNNAIALHAIGRAEKQLELEARWLGELNDAAKVAVGINLNPQPAHSDLSRLTDEELAQVKVLAQKVAIQAQGAMGGIPEFKPGSGQAERR